MTTRPPPRLSILLLAFLFAGGAASSEDGTSAFALLARSLEKCGRWSELGTCLRVRAVGLLDRALHSGPIEINDYLSLTPDPGAAVLAKEKTGRALSEMEIEQQLPKEQEAKDSALDDMIAEKMTSFIGSRSLRFNVPADLVEGRKKGGGGGGGGGKKGGGMMMMAALAMGGMMVQMAMAKIALLAGKALLIGKMALLLSAIIGLKKLVGGGGGESHQVVYATESHGGGGGGGGHGWGRSGPQIAAAHELAYSAQARAANQAK